MNRSRWNPYVLIKDQKLTSFWQEHFAAPHRLLFILGKGFDVRMNLALARLLRDCPSINMDTMLIEFDEGKSSSSHRYKSLVDDNVIELEDLLAGRRKTIKHIDLWQVNGRKKKRIGDRQAAGIINNVDEISAYSDIIIDISALPRGVYFSLIGKLLAFSDNCFSSNPPNIFAIISENASLDAQIKEEGIDEDLNFLHGFGGNIDLEAEAEKPIIWLPILGEDKLAHISKAFSHITERQTSPYEICTVLPFPSKDVRRVDKLIVDYHRLLFDELRIEAQNIIYVPEQNPFEAYVRLVSTIQNYADSLAPLSGCRAVISTFSSKLLSIGTLLAAYELKQDIGVGVLNVDALGYKIDDIEQFKNAKADSELFLTWLTGKPYSE